MEMPFLCFSRLNFSPTPLFPLPHLNYSCFHYTLHSVPPNPFDEETGGAGGWEQCAEVSFYYYLLLTAPLLWHRLPLGHSPFRGVPAPAQVTQKMQSLRGVPPPAQSTSFQGCISIRVPNNVSFHASPSLLLPFLQKILFTYLLTCPLLSVLPCPLSFISFLHLLPPAAAALPQTRLKRSAVWSSVWLKFWGVMHYFHPFRATWNPL